MVIRYDAGHMEVHLNGFFPTTNKRTKALLKVIAMSYSREAHLLTLKVFFSQAIEQRSVEMGNLGSEYKEIRQAIVELEERVRSRKESNGLPIPAESLKVYAKTLIETEKKLGKIERNHKKSVKEKEQLEKNLKTVKEESR